MPAANEKKFLGIDSSTQGIKATLIDTRLKVIHEEAINFDKDLPQYKTDGGVHRGADGLTVTSPTLMFVEALDLLLERMQAAGCDLASVAAISGSGQQHGSVWMNSSARTALKNMNPGQSLKEQLKDAFTLQDSPIWMDSSTAKQCQEREKALGGAQAVAELTGSRAYERFTGNQIAKIYQQQRQAYRDTDRIALISSFITSLLAGQQTPIDASDGAGMNLMDLRSRTWSTPALDCTAPGLADKIGPIVPSHRIVARLHPYFTKKYGFGQETQIVAFSGDNPCSLAGLRLQHTGDVAISLGTSDTLFGSLAEPTPSASEGHIFPNPVAPQAYMAMVCYKNGSLTRELVRDQNAGGTWEGFGKALAETQPGNGGHIGFYIKEPEITPPILKTGIFRFSPDDRKLDTFPAARVDVRAVVEGQFLSMRMHGANIGIQPKSILATGGASTNAGIVQIVSDVFGVPVFTAEQPNSASLGAAYRAFHGFTCEQAGSFVPFAEVMKGAPAFNKSAEPNTKAHAVYTGMLERYGKLEAVVIGAR